MRRRLLIVLFLVCLGWQLTLVGPTQANAHHNRWAFTKHDVLVRKTALQWALNGIFDAFAPIPVRCQGKKPVRLTGGRRGFVHIRCTTGLNIPDFIYHLNARGKLVVTRSWA